MFRKPFGSNNMGGSGGTGGMLRALSSRVAVSKPGHGKRANATSSSNNIQQDPFLTSTSTRTKQPTSPTFSTSSVVSPFNNSSQFPLWGGNYGYNDSNNNTNNNSGLAWQLPPSSIVENDWISVDGHEDDEKSEAVYDDYVFGSVPSLDEVEYAVTAMKQVFNPAYCVPLGGDDFSYDPQRDGADQNSSLGSSMRKTPSSGSECDWLEPSQYLHQSRMLQPFGFAGAYDALHLLKTDPLVQKMVLSLSSDKTVWNAVLNNEMVQEIKKSLSAGENNGSESSDDDQSHPNAVIEAVKWILNNTKAKITQVIEALGKQVNNLFQPPIGEKTRPGAADLFNEKLKASFVLSVVVLLIVVVTRANSIL